MANLPLQEEELAIDEDLNVQSNSRRNSFARRRGSLGSCATMEESEESIQDQNRLAEMYKSIIKMSSENVRQNLHCIVALLHLILANIHRKSTPKTPGTWI